MAKNQINTSTGMVQFIEVNGKVTFVAPESIYRHYNEDTVSVLTLEIEENSGNAFFTSRASDLLLNGEQLTDANFQTKIEAAIAASEGGGGGGGVTPEQVEIMIDDATEGLVADAEYDSIQHVINFKNEDGDIVCQIDATDFIKDGMVQNVEISNGYLVITFNTDAGKSPISIELEDIFDPTNYYNKTEIDNNLQTLSNTLYGVIQDVDDALTAHTSNSDIHVTTANKNTWNNKQDALVSGTNIKSINNESILGSGNISIQSGDVNVQSDWNQTDSTADDFIKNKPNIPDVTNYYTKTEVDNNLQTLSNTLYTAINTKADSTTVYTKTEIDNTLNNYYTKTQTDNAISTAVSSAVDIVQVTGSSTTSVMSQNAVTTELNNKADASRLGGLSFVKITKAQYDALTEYDNSILYIIVD